MLSCCGPSLKNSTGGPSVWAHSVLRCTRKRIRSKRSSSLTCCRSVSFSAPHAAEWPPGLLTSTSASTRFDPAKHRHYSADSVFSLTHGSLRTNYYLDDQGGLCGYESN